MAEKDNAKNKERLFVTWGHRIEEPKNNSKENSRSILIYYDSPVAHPDNRDEIKLMQEEVKRILNDPRNYYTLIRGYLDNSREFKVTETLEGINLADRTFVTHFEYDEPFTFEYVEAEYKYIYSLTIEEFLEL